MIVAAQFMALGGGEEAAAPPVAVVPERAVRPITQEPLRPLPVKPLLEARAVNAYMLQHMQQKAVNQPDVGAFTKLVTFEEPQR